MRILREHYLTGRRINYEKLKLQITIFFSSMHFDRREIISKDVVIK
jgi:hypothetical protein